MIVQNVAKMSTACLVGGFLKWYSAMISKQMMMENQIVLEQNPSNHAGFENESSHIHKFVSWCNAVAKMLHGIPMSAQIAKIQEIHKKRIKSGVKIKFDSGLM